MSLQVVAAGHIWHRQQALSSGLFPIATRMTVVRLKDGNLWIHSPVAPTSALLASLSALGDVRHVVAPNKSHHLFFLSFLGSQPEARGWIAPGLLAKRPDFAPFSVLSAETPWHNELVPYFIDGLLLINETVWFHVATGTLIVMDLLFSLGPDNGRAVRLVARLLGICDRLAMSHSMKLMIKDRQAFAASVRPLLSLDVRRIILAHDQIITGQAREKLAQAFSWLDT